jgi:hypothetical protein
MNDTRPPTPRAGIDSDTTAAARSPPAAPKAGAKRAQPPQSRFEKYAATQAGGDGIEGEVLKSGKTPDEKIGASMPDRK